MKIAVRIRTPRDSDALRAYIRRRFEASLARFADRVGHLSVLVSNGERTAGRRMYLCRAEVEVRPSAGPLLQEAAHHDLHAAIDLTADQLGRALHRRLAPEDGERYVRSPPPVGLDLA